MLKKLRRITTKTRFSNPWWDYNLDIYRMPNGEPGEYHYVNSRGATMVIPVTADNKVVFIRQVRYLNDRESLEFPGGGIKEGLTAEKNAVEELGEETGYQAAFMKKIGGFNPYNGVTNEICSVFFADGLVKKGKASPDSSEEFEIVELDYYEIINKIKQGEIWDGMTLASWTLFVNSELISRLIVL